MAFELQTARLKQKVTEEKMQIKVIERSKEISLEEQEILRKEQELEANVKVPAMAEKYRYFNNSLLNIVRNFFFKYISNTGFN